MKTSLLTSIMIFLFGIYAFSRPIPPDSLYFGQTPPGDIPQLFAPGIVTLPGRNEAAITFSPDGALVFFYIEKYPQPGNPFTLYATYTNNHWTTPDTIPFSYGRATGEPFFSYGGNRVYMYATNALNHTGIVDLSYSERQGANWSDPVSMGNPPNSEAYQYHPCIVGDTSVYFSSNAGDVCRCQYENGVYQGRVILPVPINHMGSPTWGDPYVSPDESYMILKSIRAEGYGQNDLYIAYKKTNGTWTNPKNLGNIINTPADETSGDITPDGLYMTYGSNKDLYWISTGFIDSLKFTNYLPYIKNQIPDQAAILGELFTCTIPDSTFVDDDGDNTLTYGSKLTNGDPLPSWLTFDTITASFSGIPPTTQTLNIKVTATDSAQASASGNLKITITPHTSTDQINQETGGERIFPNPTSGLINISLNAFSGNKAIAEVRTLQGKAVLSTSFNKYGCIDMTGNPKGIYILKLLVGNEITVRKICLQ
ncbi:MAG: putative Ig domain-containing protein [Bacteroidetes bacterium]|nr:putative Ig domain-containing protein [Bacteroidota bacterium]